MTKIVAEQILNDQTLLTQIQWFFHHYLPVKVLQQCGFYKLRGVSCLKVLQELFPLVFTHKNLWRTLQSEETLPFKKNTGYRFMNHASFHWEKLLLRVATSLLTHLNSLTPTDRVTALVIDDSLISRNRSKKVELLARCYDHASQTFQKGFRMLTIGWTDGCTFLPLQFRLLSSSQTSNVLCPAKTCDRRSLAHQRRRQAQTPATELLLQLLPQLKAIPAKYVLMDSWFCLPKLLIAIHQMGRTIIGMVRITDKVHYFYQGQWQSVKKIYAQTKLPPREGNTLLGAARVKVRPHIQESSDTWIDAQLVFVRRRSSEAWLSLLCTDSHLDPEEVVRIYGKRWDIEVFFKMCKSHLALGKEFQGRSLEMQIASTTLVCLRYLMIALWVRREQDQRSWGELFYRICDEVQDISLFRSLKLLLLTLWEKLQSFPELSNAVINTLMKELLLKLPAYARNRLYYST